MAVQAIPPVYEIPKDSYSTYISIFFKTVQTMSSLLLYIYILVVGFIFFFVRACAPYGYFFGEKIRKLWTAFLYFPPIQPFTAKAPIRRFDLAIE